MKNEFKNWGTKNGWNDERRNAFREVEKIHELDMIECPQNHEWVHSNRYGSCWTFTSCKCGFGYDVDSSD